MTLKSRIKQLEDQRGTPIEPEDLAGMTPQERYLAMLHPRHAASGRYGGLRNKTVETRDMPTITPEEAYRRAIQGPLNSGPDFAGKKQDAEI